LLLYQGAPRRPLFLGGREFTFFESALCPPTWIPGFSGLIVENGSPFPLPNLASFSVVDVSARFFFFAFSLVCGLKGLAAFAGFPHETVFCSPVFFLALGS